MADAAEASTAEEPQPSAGQAAPSGEASVIAPAQPEEGSRSADAAAAGDSAAEPDAASAEAGANDSHPESGNDAGGEVAAATIEDLFGDEPDEPEEKAAAEAEEGAAAEPEEDAATPVDAAGLFGSESEDEGQAPAPEEEAVEVEVDEVAAPVLSSRLGDDIYIAKLPNFFSIEPRPFDRETFHEEYGEEYVVDEVGRTRVKLGVENAIRWREVEDAEGNPTRQTNARLVKWSDGTMSIVLGNEVIECNEKKLKNLNHLYAQLPGIGGVEAQHVFSSRLSFRPSVISRSAGFQRITQSVAEKQGRANQVKLINVDQDPEEQKRLAMKAADDAKRARMKLDNQAKRKRERYQSQPLTARYLEDDWGEEDVGVSINALKNSVKRGGAVDDGWMSAENSADEGFVVPDEGHAMAAAPEPRGAAAEKRARGRKMLDEEEHDDAAATAVPKRRRNVVSSDEED